MVPKPVSIRKVSYPAGHGVQPLVPVFQLSFLSGNPDFKGRKSPNDPCTYHYKNGGCLKKRVFTLHVWLHFSTYIPLLRMLQIMVAITGELYGMHAGKGSFSFFNPLSVVLTPEFSYPSNMAGLEERLPSLISVGK